MTIFYSLSKRISLALATVSIVAAFSFTACSNGSKKQNDEKNQTTTATHQQAVQAGAQTSTKVTKTKTKRTENTEAKTTSPDNTTANVVTVERGRKIIENNGCLACHSTNGKRLAGPTFKNLYGRKTTLANGKTVIANADYIAQSIKDPKAKVVKGFAPIMPKFSYLKDEQIASIIAYIKSISK